MKSEFVLGLIVGGLLVAGALFISSRAPHAKAGVRAERTADLAAELAALKHEVAAQRQLIALNANAANAQHELRARGERSTEPSSASAAEPAENDAAEAPLDAELSPEARVERRFSVVDDAFASESRDASWATDTEAQIGRTLSGFRGVRERRATCAATLCKLELDAESDAAAEDFGSRFLGELGLDASLVLRKVPSPSGGTTLQVYLSRAGRPMPE